MPNSKVILETPFANENVAIRNENLIYTNLAARILMLEKKKVALFFHTFYTQFLNDDVCEERRLGLHSSFYYHEDASAKIYAIDRGISRGMSLGAMDALEKGLEVRFFTLCSPESELYQKIEKINAIEDHRERWEAGLAYVNKLQEQNGISSKGDLTSYRDARQAEMETVKGIMNTFFAPLVEHMAAA